MTAALRAYLTARLAELREGENAPGDVLEGLDSWAQDANPAALVEWLDARDGWKRDRLEREAEEAFVDAAKGARRRFWLARLEAAAQRSRNAAALLKDPAQLDRVLARLVNPSRPLLQERFGRSGRKTDDWVTLYIPDWERGWISSQEEGPKLKENHTVLFPCLPRGSAVPSNTTAALRPENVFDTPPPELDFCAPVQHRLGLDVLRGLLSAQDWGILWAFHSDRKGERWLRVLALNWLDERLARALEAHNAKPLRLRTIRHKGRDYVKVPKVLAAVSWAMGGQATTVELDGHQYAQAPGMKTPGRLERAFAKMPLSYALLPADAAKRPHQANLPIDMGEEAPPLALAVVGAVQSGALSNAAGKLGFYLSAGWGLGVQKVTLRELTTAMNPDASLRKTHFNTVATALEELRNLRLFMLNGLAHNVYYLPRTPWKELSPEAYDLPLLASMDPGLVELLTNRSGPFQSYRGDFLVDKTGAMALPTLESGLLRQYLRPAATWNAYFDPTTKAPDPRRQPTIPMESWATYTNALPLAAVDYLAAEKRQRRGRNRMAEAITRILRELEDLAARGLVVVDKANRREVRLLMPERHLEAWWKAQERGKP